MAPLFLTAGCWPAKAPCIASIPYIHVRQKCRPVNVPYITSISYIHVGQKRMPVIVPYDTGIRDIASDAQPLRMQAHWRSAGRSMLRRKDRFTPVGQSSYQCAGDKAPLGVSASELSKP